MHKSATKNTARDGSHNNGLTVQIREDPKGAQENNPAPQSYCKSTRIAG